MIANGYLTSIAISAVAVTTRKNALNHVRFLRTRAIVNAGILRRKENDECR